jgi:hypothetical protein
MVSPTNLAPWEAHEMLSTKIRTTIITLVAASSFAGASVVVPAVSQASKNNGTYSKSSEAYKKAQQEEFCGNLSTIWNDTDAIYVGALSKNETERAAAVRATLNEIAKLARKSGCGWGQEVAPESPTALAETPVGATQGTEAALPPVQSITVAPVRATAP